MQLCPETETRSVNPGHWSVPGCAEPESYPSTYPVTIAACTGCSKSSSFWPARTELRIRRRAASGSSFTEGAVVRTHVAKQRDCPPSGQRVGAGQALVPIRGDLFPPRFGLPFPHILSDGATSDDWISFIFLPRKSRSDKVLRRPRGPASQRSRPSRIECIAGAVTTLPGSKKRLSARRRGAASAVV